MDFAPSDTQAQVREAVERICRRFDDAYWLACDREARFPAELYDALAAAGWLGICIPEAYGGSGLGLAEAAVMMQAIAQSGAALSGASAVHMNIFGLNPVVRFGTEEQKARMLPPVAAGRQKACFAVTEPDAGLDTTNLSTTAVRRGDRYVVHGAKIWISTAQVAHKMMLLARTGPGRDGLTLFYTDLDRRHVEIRAIDKMGRAAVDSNQLFIDGLDVPEEDRIGAEGQGFECLLHGLNPERVLIAAEAVGIGRTALARAASYAKERVVFGRPIGQNQAIQHPLAERWIELEAAELLVQSAAWRYEKGLPAGPSANAAKFFAAEAGVRACETAMLTLGGYGYAKEYHVERYLREVMIARLAPVSPHLALCHIAETVLGLPKSY
ncbi:MAG TPA: acyl-CoA dehydrogenase family protein [Stellaceae bacterium]|nr:acyl-CoA dehydrogenase family protein [Stellaceae bacterium]